MFIETASKRGDRINTTEIVRLWKDKDGHNGRRWGTSGTGFTEASVHVLACVLHDLVHRGARNDDASG